MKIIYKDGTVEHADRIIPTSEGVYYDTPNPQGIMMRGLLKWSNIREIVDAQTYDNELSNCNIAND